MSTPTPVSAPVHVPRVWEITGKAPEDRRRAVREWREAYRQLTGAGGRRAKQHLRRETRSR